VRAASDGSTADLGGASLRKHTAAAEAEASTRLHVIDAEPLPRPSRWALRVKRCIDVAIASVGLVLTLPLFAVIAVVIKATSRGPVFFLQERVGQAGELFTLIKFRTMRDGTHAEVLADDEERRRYVENDFKLRPDDDRITRVGRFLRKTSLDELPQLIHVIRGEMSLVGIRPLVEMEVARRTPYDQACYELLKPGMTGLWQVEGRSAIAHDDRFTLDRRYVKEWSLVNDLVLLLRTPFAVVRVSTAH
jgi:exopolysaccharide production protein ExoY